jgi:hypothetical protein
VILYASVPGAFVDLAADLGWLTGRDHSSHFLDRHLTRPADGTASVVRVSSAINQAVGVLIGTGRTPEDAHHYLVARAVAGGVALHEAATTLLYGLPESAF